MNHILLNTIIDQYPDLFESKKIQPKEIIISQGYKPSIVFWVKGGIVKAFHTNENGQEFLIELFGTGEIFGELEFFDKKNYFASVESITNCDIVFINHYNFEQLLKIESSLLRNITDNMAARLLKISERTVSRSYFPLEYLIVKFLLSEMKSKNEKLLSISKTNLAQYFGTNIRSINRILKSLAESKCIKISENHVEILSNKKIMKILKNYT